MPKSIHTSEYAVLRAELRQIREAADLSQRELAARLQVPPSWVAKVETGERRLDVVEFCWFVAACNAGAAPIISHVAEQIPKSRIKGGRR